MVDITGKVRHTEPILKGQQETSAASPPPCYVRQAKKCELIKAHAESGLNFKEIAAKMKVPAITVAHAARNHKFEIKDDSGEFISGATLAARLVRGEYAEEKPDSWPTVLAKGQAAIARLEKKAAENIIRIEDDGDDEDKEEEAASMDKNICDDPVTHPAHYCDGGIETIDFIEAKGLGYHLGNAVKYITRAGKKDPSKYVEDLRKAIWYINRKIEEEKGKDGRSGE